MSPCFIENHTKIIGMILRHRLIIFGAIFIVYITQRITKKLRIIFLLRFGLETSRIHFRKTRQPLIFMLFGVSDVTVTPTTNYLYLSRHRETSHNSRNKRILSKKYVGNLNIWEIQKFDSFGKDMCRTILTIRLIHSITSLI